MLRNLLILLIGVAIAAELIAVRSPLRTPQYESSVSVLAYVNTPPGAMSVSEQPTDQWFKAMFLSGPVMEAALQDPTIRRYDDLIDRRDSTVSKAAALRDLVEDSTSFESESPPGLAGILMSVRFRTANPEAGNVVLAAVFKAFVRVVENQQAPQKGDLFHKLKSVQHEQLLPEIEDAERRYGEIQKRLALLPAGSDSPEEHELSQKEVAQLRKQYGDEQEDLENEIEQLKHHYKTVVEKLDELNLAADPSQVVIKTASDGISSTTIDSTALQAIVLTLRLFAIAVAITSGVITLRRRRASSMLGEH